MESSHNSPYLSYCREALEKGSMKHEEPDMQGHYDELFKVEEKNDKEIDNLTVALDALFKVVVRLSRRINILEGKNGNNTM